jgi:hypothetical protein
MIRSVAVATDGDSWAKSVIHNDLAIVRPSADVDLSSLDFGSVITIWLVDSAGGSESSGSPYP